MTMATLRRWHFYLGMFIAPSVLFFAITGAWQLFSLHESHGAYDPPPIVEKLSAVHKDQVFARGHHHDHGPPAVVKAAGAAPAPAADDDDDKPSLSTRLLKIYFLAVALGLVASTVLGLWIGLTRAAERRTGWALLIAGAVAPLVLLLV